MMCSLSKLGTGDMDSIHDLEKELGKPLLAFSCHAVEHADLTADQISKIKALESKLGMALVAVSG